MDAELSRKTAIIIQSPLFYSISRGRSSEFIEHMTKIGSFEKLPPHLKEFFRRCELSFEVARGIGINGTFYTNDQIKVILDVLADRLNLKGKPLIPNNPDAEEADNAN